ncbi:MAG: FtsX-like permease family protein [Saprospiraceae bacterium]|nr:FtsX-like permease family protein [Saprospiraceae bacterium]
MGVLIKIAWRNIWRSRTRSLVVLGAISLGIWALIFLLSFSRGMVYNLIDNSIRREIGHLQLEHPEFNKQHDFRFHLENADSLGALFFQDPGVVSVSERAVSMGMVSSAKGARGVRIWGIDPERERGVTFIADKIVEGEFLEPGRNPILMSSHLAGKLGLKMRSKAVLTFQDLEGNITAGAFRITGLFDSGTTPFDEGTVMVRREDLLRLTGGADRDIAQQIVAIVDDPDSVEVIRDRLAPLFPGAKLRTYEEVAPEVALYESQIGLTNMIVITIFMLALIFGIINTMLMAVLERVRELGMLMAIGMNRRRVFLMVMFETLFLGLTAMPVGIGLVMLTLKFFEKTGIDLSIFSEGMREFGMSEIVYPDPVTSIYFQVAGAVFLTAFLGAIYPAWKAIRLKPVEALSKI